MQLRDRIKAKGDYPASCMPLQVSGHVSLLLCSRTDSSGGGIRRVVPKAAKESDETESLGSSQGRMRTSTRGRRSDARKCGSLPKVDLQL
jgi:hypothetical protein